jgi:hypothetical protein
MELRKLIRELNADKLSQSNGKLLYKEQVGIRRLVNVRERYVSVSHLSKGYQGSYKTWEDFREILNRKQTRKGRVHAVKAVT